MRHSSYHVHTTFCDGSASPGAMIEAAVGQNMSAIGFSAHAAWPFASEWHLSPKAYGDYLAEISRLKEPWGNRIRVLCGFEADWIPGVTAPDPAFYGRFNPDFLIGSVHYVVPENRKVGLWSVDAPTEEVARGLEASFGGNGKKAVCAYYAAVREMAETCTFDIVGHLDLPRKRNGALKFFDESASWYRREIRETVKTIARKNLVIELNTGAIARKAMDGIYPSDEILALLRKADARVTINSDAHAPQDIACAYDRALASAQKAGFRELWQLSPNGWAAIPIQ